MAGRPRGSQNLPKPEPLTPTKETSATLAIEEPKYWVDVKPVAKRQPYASKDYWYYEARVFRGDEQVGESECFYPEEVDIMPGQHRQADIKHWAHNRMQLDKARRGELESFTIDLEEEE